MPIVEPRVPPSRWRLSEEGRRQSAVLAERLKDYGLERVVASEELKAAETAEILAAHLDLGWAVAPRLHEHDRTGAPFGTQREFESAARNLFENPGDLVWGNETADQARSRFGDGVHAVLEKHPEGNLAVVAHGTVNTLLVSQYNDVAAYEFWYRLGLPSSFSLSLPDFGLQDVVFGV